MAAEDCYVSDFTMLAVFVVTLLLVYLNTRRPNWAPPGPQLLPVIGNLLCLARNPLTALADLRAKYGDVIGLYIGSELTVFVHGYDAVHEVLVKRGNLFSWRPETPFARSLLTVRSLVFANGKRWKENRQFTQNTFQKLCFSNRSKWIEEKINDELSFFVDKLKTMTHPTDIARDISLSLSNVIFSILHGYRPGYTDSKLLWYLDRTNKAVKSFRRKQVLTDCFPFIGYWPFNFVIAYKFKELERLFETYLLEIHTNYVEGEETCFVHHLISSFKADNADKWRQVLSSNPELWSILSELMSTGGETTATTIKWILLYMIRNPRIQKEARDEVVRVIGETETPSIHHRKQTPYLEAVVLEGLRIGQVAPLGIPHSTMQDVDFRGYHIPKNTSILVNISSVLKDPVIFPDPECFIPERFLADDRTTVVVPEQFLPFSKGPRSCPGESIARIELFLYMATLLQKFEFHSADPDSLPETSGDIGLTYTPKPFKLKITAL